MCDKSAHRPRTHRSSLWSSLPNIESNGTHPQRGAHLLLKHPASISWITTLAGSSRLNAAILGASTWTLLHWYVSQFPANTATTVCYRGYRHFTKTSCLFPVHDNNLQRDNSQTQSIAYYACAPGVIWSCAPLKHQELETLQGKQHDVR